MNGSITDLERRLVRNLTDQIKRQRYPKSYCLVGYEDLVNGGVNYVICADEKEFENISQNRFRKNVKIFWASEEFKKTHKLFYIVEFHADGGQVCIPGHRSFDNPERAKEFADLMGQEPGHTCPEPVVTEYMSESDLGSKGSCRRFSKLPSRT